jgi:hypothetical protein
MFESDKWSVFAAAIVGAAAALMGLLVVAVSVRLDILTRRRAAATRGAQALLLLTLPFVAGVLDGCPRLASPGPHRNTPPRSFERGSGWSQRIPQISVQQLVLHCDG